MRKGIIAGMAAFGIALASGACGVMEPDDLLGAFEWSELEGAEVEEGTDAMTAGRTIWFVGQFATPTACYQLVPEVSKSGSLLTLTVLAERARSSTTCEQRAGAYRYEGTAQLPDGVQEFRIVHQISDGESKEFRYPLTAS